MQSKHLTLDEQLKLAREQKEKKFLEAQKQRLQQLFQDLLKPMTVVISDNCINGKTYSKFEDQPYYESLFKDSGFYQHLENYLACAGNFNGDMAALTQGFEQLKRLTDPSLQLEIADVGVYILEELVTPLCHFHQQITGEEAALADLSTLAGASAQAKAERLAAQQIEDARLKEEAEQNEAAIQIKQITNIFAAPKEHFTTPLLKAIQTGNLRVVKYFLEHFDDSTIKFYKSMKSPLDRAVECGNLDVIKLLVESGRNFQPENPEPDDLFIFQKTTNPAIVRYLETVLPNKNYIKARLAVLDEKTKVWLLQGSQLLKSGKLNQDIFYRISAELLDLMHVPDWHKKVKQILEKVINWQEAYKLRLQKYSPVQVDLSKITVTGIEAIQAATRQILVLLGVPNPEDCFVQLKRSYQSGSHRPVFSIGFKEQKSLESMLGLLKFRDISTVLSTDSPYTLYLLDFKAIQAYFEVICKQTWQTTRDLFVQEAMGYVYYRHSGIYADIIRIFSEKNTQVQSRFQAISIWFNEHFMYDGIFDNLTIGHFSYMPDVFRIEPHFSRLEKAELDLIRATHPFTDQQQSCLEFYCKGREPLVMEFKDIKPDHKAYQFPGVSQCIGAVTQQFLFQLNFDAPKMPSLQLKEEGLTLYLHEAQQAPRLLAFMQYHGLNSAESTIQDFGMIEFAPNRAFGPFQSSVTIRQFRDIQSYIETVCGFSSAMTGRLYGLNRLSHVYFQLSGALEKLRQDSLTKGIPEPLQSKWNNFLRHQLLNSAEPCSITITSQEFNTLKALLTKDYCFDFYLKLIKIHNPAPVIPVTLSNSTHTLWKADDAETINFAKAMLEKRANSPSAKKDTALIEAINTGNVKVVQYILEQTHCDIEERDGFSDNGTPLIHAVVLGKLDIVKLLVNKGANLKASFGTTALGVLDLARNPEIKKFLEEKLNEMASSPSLMQ